MRLAVVVVAAVVARAKEVAVVAGDEITLVMGPIVPLKVEGPTWMPNVVAAGLTRRNVVRSWASVADVVAVEATMITIFHFHPPCYH